ncbi:hypothetical protein DXX99_06285 [Ammonifex thiophilus]|uniref:Uncharacterized protein n=1 Tax=Ammonifex thiophilus TaxID=444093 RepID=A0A3D8P4U7_9THEO|nr:hypothetical protein DXX99_06285 [Ammonifex thiophilus]
MFFGAVEGGSWVFYLNIGKEVGEAEGKELLEKTVKWLDYAFSTHGVGAKTGLGYGLMSVSVIELR